MNQHDTIVREVEQLARVLAVVLFHKQAGRAGEAEQVLTAELARALGVGPEALDHLPRHEVLAACSAGGAFAADKALAIADVLREGASAARQRRALWLYRAALASGQAVPFDIYERMATCGAVSPD